MSNAIIVVKRGGLFIARYAGKPNRVFGATPNEASNRLQFAEWCDHSVDGRKRVDGVPSVFVGFGKSNGHIIFKEIAA